MQDVDRETEPGAARILLRCLPQVVLGLGLVGAIVAGFAAYRLVGPYGDGPFGAGFRRIPDRFTGRPLLVFEYATTTVPIQAHVDERTGRFTELRYDSNADGHADQRVHVQSDGRLRVEIDLDGNGVIDRWQYYASVTTLERDQVERVGFSTAGDGVVDAWQIIGPVGPTGRVEVSTGRDGRIDRWEQYENGLLSRVDEDTDGDGRGDAWWIYDGGVLIATSGSRSTVIRGNPSRTQ